ncbi:class I SAM-dependent methyltransferase [Mangrovimicrobium sediminis]|uniref:Class I SAM-dependent methyltransferase n=1 Tax=Mangrovimicrobium sediminis TaxID=2562682 RepID=A0A4Z0M0Q2_9GAMM|nr:class I SAM-dependent methyltransferase [Haliea sp. SAOS-164]TGD72948.1 class I SAM-dependent methyltransferase [Haliea sp. SAOS-164]
MQTVDFTFFPLLAGDVVLDLGCGEGRHVISAYLEAEVHSIGVDLSLPDLLTTREKMREFSTAAQPANDVADARSFGLSSASALALPFADNTFDKVICSEVLEHIPDYQSALREIERVLKPGGLFCASVPRRWPEKLCWMLSEGYHNTPGGHIRIFRARELRRDIETLGMDHYHRHWAHALHAPFWWLKCLFWNRREEPWLVRQYHRLLVWDLMQRPRLTRVAEQLLNPLMGKSVVMYFRKSAAL